MSDKQTRNGPFGLDMSFAEALERYIGTDREEALSAGKGQSPEGDQGEPEVLTWQKNLSTTDAQQPTSGSLVPYLRLTSGSLTTGGFQTWFRQTFFDNVPWKAGHFNKKPVEEAHVPFDVTIAGVSLGPVLFTVTHDDTRQDSHNAPNTWLHWPDKVASILENNNYSARPVILTRDDTGAFSLEIQ